MEGWSKGLIAAACVAIIAGVGYYFWQQYEDSKRAARLAEVHACQASLDGYISDTTSSEKKNKVKSCLMRGLINEADVSRKISEKFPLAES